MTPPAPDRPAALELEGVSHAYGPIIAVEDAGFSVRPGEILCLLGPSGCGKSTLLRVVAGLERSQEGRIRIGGREVAAPGVHVPPEDRSVTLLFQDFALFPHLTVLQNVAFGLRRLDPGARVERAREMLGQVGMLDHADRFPHTLSGGEQQRVALARARAPRPRAMLLDEPFSSLDMRLRVQLRDRVLHVLKRTEAATVIVTHDPEEAMFMGDRIAVMREGRIVQTGTPREIYDAPATPFVAGLLGEVNRIPGRAHDGHVHTALGRICAAGFDDGAAVDVLLRPECLALRPRGASGRGAAAGRVVMSRTVGHTNVVHLSVPGAGGADLHVHARTMGASAPHPDEEVDIVFDGDRAFLYPASGRDEDPGP